MKYGTDSWTLDTVQHSLLSHIGKQQDIPWHLWIDLAFDVADERTQHPTPAGLNVYQVDNMLDLQHLGPRIITVFYPGDNANQTTQRLRPWLEHANGRPMLSLWASERSPQDLAQHIRHWSWAQTPEQEQVLLRLADTRSACSLNATLTPAQWQALTQPLRHWLYLDRQGAVQALPTGGAKPATDTAQLQAPLQLSQAQLQAMAERAEADALLHHVATQLPELLPSGAQPSKMHDYTAWVCQTAQQKGIEPWQDKLSLLLAACASKGAVMQDPRLSSLLVRKTHTPGQLHQALHQEGLLA